MIFHSAQPSSIRHLSNVLTWPKHCIMILPECGANRSVEGVFNFIHRSSYSFPTYCGPLSVTISGGGPNVLVLLAVAHALINVSICVWM